MTRRPYSIPGSLLCAFLVVCIGQLPPGPAELPPAAALAAVLIPICAVFGVPFGYWLPIARARFFLVQRVPSETILLPRFLVCMIATPLIGVVIGCGILGIVLDSRYLILGLGYMLCTAAFTLSAVRRFRHHPLAEFVMPLPWFFLLRGRT